MRVLDFLVLVREVVPHPLEHPCRFEDNSSVFIYTPINVSITPRLSSSHHGSIPFNGIDADLGEGSSRFYAMLNVCPLRLSLAPFTFLILSSFLTSSPAACSWYVFATTRLPCSRYAHVSTTHDPLLELETRSYEPSIDRCFSFCFPCTFSRRLAVASFSL